MFERNFIKKKKYLTVIKRKVNYQMKLSIITVFNSFLII